MFALSVELESVCFADRLDKRSTTSTAIASFMWRSIQGCMNVRTLEDISRSCKLQKEEDRTD